ncbi:hypothetical protein CFP56_024732 [Quercus suber]|uniref:Uncharacterized protein n=1 Tax=Quercus suber TaxID=58331 RepID=A0AAW0K585_QUESU
MAAKALSSSLVALLIFAIILSPISTCDAVRFTQRASGPICPACVCCTPAPPGSCCQCCATPVETQSENGTP